MSYDPGPPQQPGYRRAEPLPPDLLSTLRNSSQQPPYARSRFSRLQQKKISRRWFWMLFAVICVLIIVALLVARYLTTLTGPTVTADNYYQAVTQKNYQLAYSYLANNATLTSQNQKVPIGSQQDYATSAHLLDSHIGAVTSYKVATTSNSTLLLISITRSQNAHSIHYSARFTMIQIDGNWRIRDMNGGF